MTEAPTVTLSMFWPLLLQAAENDYNPNAHAAIARLLARPGFDADTLSAEGVAEEIARQHFPSGTTEEVVGFYRMESGEWMTDQDSFDCFENMALNQYDGEPLMPTYKGGLISPTDPGHVAMVIRMLAISYAIPVYVESPTLEIKHNRVVPDDDCEPSGEMGFMVACVPSRPPPAGAQGFALGAGLYLPYQPGESAKNFDVGAAVFRWMAERHAEIVKATEAQDAAESSKDTEPDHANVIEFKAT